LGRQFHFTCSPAGDLACRNRHKHMGLVKSKRLSQPVPCQQTA
jgi:hypothetical protein